MTKIGLNKHWKFLLDDPLQAQNHSFWDKGHDDSSWKDVTIPHDWSIEYPFSQEYSSGTGYVAGGIGWYRLHFTLPNALRGKKIWLEFDGIYKNSQVWCNSYYLGKRPNGYTSFRHDISEQASFGELENVIAVKVTHTDIADSRWFTGSGITRKVTLHVQDSIYIQPDSLFFTTPEVSSDKAYFNISLDLTNESNLDEQVTASLSLENNSSSPNVNVSTNYALLKNSTQHVTLQGTIPSPLLWDAMTPNLYTLKVTLAYASAVSQPYELQVGIREIHFDPNKGMFVNGQPIKLKGVCLHHDAGCLGAAVHKNIWKRRLLKLKAMGSNAIRCSHNPHMPELYELCDELGFYVIDEAFDEWEGPKNKWSTGHNVYPPLHQGYYEEFPQWYEKDLSAMVLRGRNHPSIILWSTGNEIDYPNDPYCHPLFETMTGNNDANKPASERQYNPNKPNADRLSIIAKRLTDCVKCHDTTRGVTLAAAYPELSTHIGFIDSLDVVGYNYKEEFYEEDHKRFPDKPFMGSECGHTYTAWLSAKNNAYISGQFLWTGIDYLGEAYGWPIHGSSAGLLTLAGFEKSGYWFRQSLWSTQPILSIITSTLPIQEPYINYLSTWNYAIDDVVTVRAYTNCIKAEALINGKSQGIKDFDESSGYIEWALAFEPGTLLIKGWTSQGDCIESSLQTIGSAVRLQASVWDDTILADGEMLIQIEVNVQDYNGNRCESDSTLLTIDVSGEASLVGIENGDLSDITSYTQNYRHTHHGQLIVYCRTTETAGDIHVSISGLGLKSKHLLIQSKISR